MEPKPSPIGSSHNPHPNFDHPMTASDDHHDEISSSTSQETPLTCENMDTSMSWVNLVNLTTSLDPECHLVIRARGEQCHNFDNFGPKQAIPCVVLSASHFKVG